MRVEWLDPAGLSEVALGHWRDLAARAAVPNPFFEPGFLLPAVRHLGGAGVELLVARRPGGDWAGALPVRRQLRWRRLPVLARAGWQHDYAFLGAPLLAAGDEARALAHLLHAARRRAGLVALEPVPGDGPFAAALAAALDSLGTRPVEWERFERGALHRRAQDDYVASTLSSKRRRELRRQRKLLAGALGGEVATTDRAGDPAAVTDFLALEAAGWKGERSTAMASASAGRFFAELCAAFAAEGRLQLLELGGGGTPAAMKCNLLAGEGVFTFKIAFDERFAAFSPGVQLELDNIAIFHGSEELAWMDSCAEADNCMIARLWPDRRRLSIVLVPGNGNLGRLARAESQLVAALRRQIKERRAE